MPRRKLSDVRMLMAKHRVTQEELGQQVGLSRGIVGMVITREDDVADRWYEAVERIAAGRETK